MQLLASARCLGQEGREDYSIRLREDDQELMEKPRHNPKCSIHLDVDPRVGHSCLDDVLGLEDNSNLQHEGYRKFAVALLDVFSLIGGKA